MDISSDYDITLNPVERNHKVITVNQGPKQPEGNESGYLCQLQWKLNNAVILDTVPPIRKTSRDLEAREVTRWGCFRTLHEATYSQVTKIVEYSSTVFSLNQDNSEDENTEYIPTFDTPHVAYENAVYFLDQGHTSQDEGTGFTPKQEACPDEYEAIDGQSSVYFYQNALFFTNTHSTVADQLVPQSDHLCGNMQEKVNGVTCTCTRFLLGTETGEPHMEARYQEQETSPQLGDAVHDITSKNTAGVSERNTVVPLWLNDHKLRITFDV